MDSLDVPHAGRTRGHAHIYVEVIQGDAGRHHIVRGQLYDLRDVEELSETLKLMLVERLATGHQPNPANVSQVVLDVQSRDVVQALQEAEEDIEQLRARDRARAERAAERCLPC